ncbi:MAG TPA: hypothetical protein VM012_00130, partial [Flavitalea sp.]|nr:hypothetical protein [Flavitalea sp.]
VEGKYYTWSKNEIKSILGDKAELFCDFFDVSEKGNWEHTNILRVLKPFAGFAAEVKRDENKLREEVERLSNILLEEREKRIRPLLDDKILLGWNALMITAYSKAYAATDEPAYRQAAVRNFSFLWENFRSKDGTWRHTFKNGEARYPAFLDDLAYLVQACIHLQEITGEGSYLIKGKELTERIINEFGSESNSFFYYTPEGQKDVIVRKQEIYDGATPSGNSVMAWNLYYLGIVFDRQNWLEQALKMCNSLEPVILKYPSSFGIWATLMQSLAYGIPEIALIGENFGNLYRDILRTFIPFKIFQSAPRPSKDFPLLDNKPYTSEPKLYLCKNYSCQSPVTEIDTLIRMLEKA